MDGEYLRKKIKSRGFSQKAVAEMLGMSEQALNGRLNAKSLSYETVELILKAIGVNLTDLIENKDMCLVDPNSNDNIPLSVLKIILEERKRSDEKINELIKNQGVLLESNLRLSRLAEELNEKEKNNNRDAGDVGCVGASVSSDR